jgi:hypothetical protein
MLALPRQRFGESSEAIAACISRGLGNLFELEDLGAKELRGITGSVRAWAALRPAPILCSGPAPQQGFKFFFPTNERSEAAAYSASKRLSTEQHHLSLAAKSLAQAGDRLVQHSLRAQGSAA